VFAPAVLALAVSLASALPDDPAGEAALQAELNSDQILPETNKQKDAAYGRKYVLTTFASGDCSGQPTGKPRKLEACAGSPTLQECPKQMWTKAFSCRRTEKLSDNVYSQYWSWGVFNDKFTLRFHTDDQAWKATDEGKVVGSPGATTCFSSINDIRHVFLLHDVNTPSCRVDTKYGTERELLKNRAGQHSFLRTQGSFTITPATYPANGPRDHSIRYAKPMSNPVEVNFGEGRQGAEGQNNDAVGNQGR